MRWPKRKFRDITVRWRAQGETRRVGAPELGARGGYQLGSYRRKAPPAGPWPRHPQPPRPARPLILGLESLQLGSSGRV